MTYAYVASMLRYRSTAEDVTALAFERAFAARAASASAGERPGRGCSRSPPTPRWTSGAGARPCWWRATLHRAVQLRAADCWLWSIGGGMPSADRMVPATFKASLATERKQALTK